MPRDPGIVEMYIRVHCKTTPESSRVLLDTPILAGLYCGKPSEDGGVSI